jgi:SAM-dependent methyltransferase
VQPALRRQRVRRGVLRARACHLDDPAAQQRAFGEIARVLRVGGVAVFLLVNRLPLLFWGRLLRHLVRPWFEPLLQPLRAHLPYRCPLPCRPMPRRWIRDTLSAIGAVDVSCHALESVWFDQHVSSARAPGRWLGQAIHPLEARPAPGLEQPGYYLQVVLTKGAGVA